MFFTSFFVITIGEMVFRLEGEPASESVFQTP